MGFSTERERGHLPELGLEDPPSSPLSHIGHDSLQLIQTLRTYFAQVENKTLRGSQVDPRLLNNEKAGVGGGGRE